MLCSTNGSADCLLEVALKCRSVDFHAETISGQRWFLANVLSKDEGQLIIACTITSASSVTTRHLWLRRRQQDTILMALENRLIGTASAFLGAMKSVCN